MIDYGPLVLRTLSGRVIDPYSVQIPRGCLGLFAEDSRQLIATIVADQDGKFEFPSIAPGRYRLVAHFDGFCIANVPLRIVRWPRGGSHRTLVLHMKLGAIDVCSYAAYK
jgi:hypothetical protein